MIRTIKLMGIITLLAIAALIAGCDFDDAGSEKPGNLQFIIEENQINLLLSGEISESELLSAEEIEKIKSTMSQMAAEKDGDVISEETNAGELGIKSELDKTDIAALKILSEIEMGGMEECLGVCVDNAGSRANKLDCYHHYRQAVLAANRFDPGSWLYHVIFLITHCM